MRIAQGRGRRPSRCAATAQYWIPRQSRVGAKGLTSMKKRTWYRPKAAKGTHQGMGPADFPGGIGEQLETPMQIRPRRAQGRLAEGIPTEERHVGPHEFGRGQVPPDIRIREGKPEACDEPCQAG